MKRPKTFHHGNLKLALLEAGRELLDESGIAGVTIRAVAAKAGVSHGAPANHFRDRQALLTGLALCEFSDIWDLIRQRLQGGAKDRIRTFLHVMTDYAFQHPARYELLWRSDLVDHSDPELESVLNAIYAALCSEIGANVDEEIIDVDTIAVTLWSMMHGYISLHLSGMFQPAGDQITGEARLDAMMSLILSVLREYASALQAPGKARRSQTTTASARRGK